jgi:hypothetical protein
MDKSFDIILKHINSNRTIVLISIVVSLILIFSITFAIIYYTVSDIPNTDIPKVNRIYDLLQQVTCELDRNNIDYIITSGTLLGSVRQQGMIPWDDDADITIIMKDHENPTQIKQKVLDCLKVLNKNNINSYEHQVGNILIAHFNNTPSCVDIFFLQRTNEDSSSFGGKTPYRYLTPFDTKYPNEYYFYNEIFPIKEYTFGPIILKGPNNPYDFLERTYPNWKYTASKWNHFRQVPKNSAQNTFEPILPDPDNKEFPWIKKECDI